jgi:hypothetical protein
MPPRATMPAVWPPDYLLFGSKVCTVCGRELPACTSYFAGDRSHEDGLTSQCRDCRNAADRERRPPGFRTRRERERVSA